MNRRRFLNSAASFFAVLATTGPKLIEDRRTVAYVAFTPLRKVEWLKRAYYVGWDPDAQTVARWKAAQRLRVAEHIVDTARGVSRLLAGGAHPAVVAAFGAAQKARLDDIRRQAPPWVQRRSVTIPGPEVP